MTARGYPDNTFGYWLDNPVLGSLTVSGVVTSTNTVTAGALPALTAWSSGTAKVNPVAREVTVTVVATTDGTNNVASCTIALSPDNQTFTTVGVISVAAAVNNVGAVAVPLQVTLPSGWYIKVTLVHATAADSVYY